MISVRPPRTLRTAISRRFPDKPWYWDRPVRSILRRAQYRYLRKWQPKQLDAERAITYGPQLQILGTLREWGGSRIFLNGYTEYEAGSFVESLIQEDWVSADVGANRGEYTLLMARKAPRGHVYAFEAAPPIHARLSAAVSLNGLHNVTVFNQAVHRYDGTCKFYFNPNPENAGLSSLTRDEALVEFEVACTTLDRQLSSLRTLDFLKIDVEGHEVDVLTGSQSILTKCQPIVLFEFARFGETPSLNTASGLTDLGYRLYGIHFSPVSGPILFPFSPLSEAEANRKHPSFEPINLVAIHPLNERTTHALMAS